jgi:hypothetical protein
MRGKYLLKLGGNIHFQIYTTVNVHIVFFWLVTSCSIVSGYKRLGDTYCLRLQTRP